MIEDKRFTRNPTFDILKCVLSFWVICIHKSFPGVIGEIINTVARTAVPLFFMITGFFYIDVKARDNEKKQIRKIFLLMIISNVTYFILELLIAVTKGHGATLEFIHGLNFERFINFLLFNDTRICPPLWYLSALLYVLIIIRVVHHRNIKVEIILVGVMLSVGECFGEFAMFIFGRSFPEYLSRNFLFIGLPYFLIGCIIRNKEQIIIERVNKVNGIICIIISLLFMTVEKIILNRMLINRSFDHYVSTTFLTLSIFVLMLILTRDSDKSALGGAPLESARTTVCIFI